MKDLDIKRCLDGRVEAGVLSREAAEQALKHIRDLERQYADHMAPEAAQSAAIAETARIMKEAAEREKARTAKQILAVARVIDDVQAHPDGVVAGGMALLVRDMRGKAQYSNVEARKENVLGQLFRRFADGLNAYRSKAAGLTQDTLGLRNMVREVFGEATNDATAKSAAKGWKDATEYAADRFIGGGGDLVKKYDWRLPQISDSKRMKDAGRAAWTEHMMQAAERGDLQILDYETGAPMSGLKLADLLRQAFDNITSELPPPPGKGGSYGRHNERRVFQWQNADGWLAYNDKFGSGQGGIYDVLVGHLEGMARDIALTEVLGPKHGATIRAVQELAYKTDAEKTTLARNPLANPVRAVESPEAIGRTYDALSGRLGKAQSEFWASLFGGLRSWQTAARLGSALVSSIPADSVTATWAAAANGMPVTRFIGAVVGQIAKEGDRQLALRMGIVSHAVMDAALGTRRFGDEMVGPKIMERMASFIQRVQGMSAWTNGLKNAWTLEMMGHVADNAARPLADVDAPLRKMLERYGISAADWDVIRAAPLVDADGARFFDPANVSDRALGDKLMEAIIQERAFAVLEPDARVRQLTSGGLPRGTFWGEVARSFWLFKSFSVTMATTHLARTFIDVNASKVAGFAAMSTLLTVAGAMSIQARQLLTGKDPRRMDDPKFWGAAYMQAGGAGIFGDFFAAGADRNMKGFTVTMAGPVAGVVDDAVRLAMPDYRTLMDGKPSHFGAEVARFIRGNLPGSNLWYSRLVTDRAIMDNVQALLDPGYRDSFSRMEERARRDYGQRFWWRPGHDTPDRAPDLGAVLPR
ncbi:hypothetical protein [Azospirillum rugosum]|uniref:Phage-related minor tail protein n=1 Tax=Azospirillum rugosum TaxID=416170 RepID=A0ABS4SDR2_9PROT|nr:hypothetical protein [Azospirillum rugosum]MBP2290713.1 hypothetical protein [Azospirillum rugosum]MDQ0525602.1 hypothetical protein [Azospirillum rugosum]